MKLETSQHLLALSRAESDARKRLRLLAVSHFVDGKSRTKIADMLKVSRRSVNCWVADYLSHGVAGLEAKKARGRDYYLSQQQREQLSDYIKAQASNAKGGRLVGQDIRAYISENFQVDYHPNAIYKLLQALGFSWITSCSRHPKQSQEAQDAFKKTGN